MWLWRSARDTIAARGPAQRASTLEALSCAPAQAALSAASATLPSAEERRAEAAVAERRKSLALGGLRQLSLEQGL